MPVTTQLHPLDPLSAEEMASAMAILRRERDLSERTLVISIALVLTNSYDELLSYVVFADWLFFGLSVAGLFVLRRRDPAPPGAFLMPGYPYTAALFVLVAAAIVLQSFVVSPRQSWTGYALLGLGALGYAISRRRAA